MGNYVLFEMWSGYRDTVISRHDFYVEQAQARLFSQFNNIESESEKYAETWLEKNSNRFNPDRHDPGEFEEQAYDESIGFYDLLSGLRDTTRLAVTAGMFHEWDKQLRVWIAAQIQHWRHGQAAQDAIWSANFSDLMDLLEGYGWSFRNQDFHKKLDTLRLVVNAYKHGLGSAFSALRLSNPEYFDTKIEDFLGTPFEDQRLDHTHLKVSDEQFRIFAEAIRTFWVTVPDTLSESQVVYTPKWIAKAFRSDEEQNSENA